MKTSDPTHDMGRWTGSIGRGVGKYRLQVGANVTISEIKKTHTSIIISASYPQHVSSHAPKEDVFPTSRCPGSTSIQPYVVDECDPVVRMTWPNCLSPCRKGAVSQSWSLSYCTVSNVDPSCVWFAPDVVLRYRPTELVLIDRKFCLTPRLRGAA